MVVLDLMLRIIGENVKEIRVHREEFIWYFKIKCSECKTEQPSEIYFKSNDEMEKDNGPGTANFLMKCKNCKKAMSLDFLNKSPLNIDCESEKAGLFASFDCRGCEITKWIPKEGIELIAAETDTIFTDVDITDVWMGYDESNGQNCFLHEPVEINIVKNRDK